MGVAEKLHFVSVVFEFKWARVLSSTSIYIYMFKIKTIQSYHANYKICFPFQLDMREQLSITDYKGKEIGYLNVSVLIAFFFMYI